MNKLELISELGKEAGITKPEAAKAVDIFFDSIAAAPRKGGRAEIRGLCSFHVKKYKGYSGRNPKPRLRIKILCGEPERVCIGICS